jgi:hypothetical protein
MDAPQITETTSSKAERRVFGFDLDWWNGAMLASLGGAAIAAAAVVFSTFVVIRLQKEAENATRNELETYKLDSSKKIAGLNRETEILRKENFETAALMEPREFPLNGVSGGEKDNADKVKSLNEMLKEFAGTKAIIVYLPESEPQTLALHIGELLNRFSGWRVDMRPFGSLPVLRYISEGIVIFAHEIFDMNPHTGAVNMKTRDENTKKLDDASKILLDRIQAQLGNNFFSAHIEHSIGGQFSPIRQPVPGGSHAESLPKDVILITVGVKPISALLSEQRALRSTPASAPAVQKWTTRNSAPRAATLTYRHPLGKRDRDD